MKCKKRLSFKIKASIVAIIMLFVLAFLYLNFVVNPIIIAVSESKIRSLTQKSVGESVREIISGNVIYDTLVNIVRNDSGDVVLISSNTFEINMLTRELLDVAQKRLDAMGNLGVEVPLGVFTGMPAFANFGPPVNIKMTPIGTIYAKFKSEFTTAGINQTNHKIFMIVETSVAIILPTVNKKVETKTEILITESLIIGKIPEVYLNSTSLDEMLNLIPIG